MYGASSVNADPSMSHRSASSGRWRRRRTKEHPRVATADAGAVVNCDVQALTPQQLWIEAFIRHVVDRTPDASPALLAPCAERLYRHLGSYGPIDVAEAEWDDLPLPGEVERRLVGAGKGLDANGQSGALSGCRSRVSDRKAGRAPGKPRARRLPAHRHGRAPEAVKRGSGNAASAGAGR